MTERDKFAEDTKRVEICLNDILAAMVETISRNQACPFCVTDALIHILADMADHGDIKHHHDYTDEEYRSSPFITGDTEAVKIERHIVSLN